jgi:hypothetical protein
MCVAPVRLQYLPCCEGGSYASRRYAQLSQQLDMIKALRTLMPYAISSSIAFHKEEGSSKIRFEEVCLTREHYSECLRNFPQE